MTPSHPTQTRRLYVLGASALIMGVLGLILLGNLDYDTQHFAPALQWLIVISFVLFIVVCSAGIFGWLLREHEVWRQAGGPAESAARVRAQANAAATRALRPRYPLRPQYRDVPRVLEKTDDQRGEG